MRGLPLGLAAMALQAPAWGHHSLVHVDAALCTEAGSVPGLVLLPFILLAAVGIVRAVVRYRSALRPPRFLEKDR